jgi:cyclopropane-fatty-acyl-phospholipid synthase
MLLKFLPISLIINRSVKALDNLEYGELHLITPEGKTIHAKGRLPGPEVTWTLYDWEVVRRLLLHGDIAVGEDYIDGKWDADSIENLFSFFLMNYNNFARFSNGKWLSRTVYSFYNRFIRRNSTKGSRKNIQAHYDVGNDFYKLWLDPSMTYSSALFANDGQNLEDAQRAKYQNILKHLGEHSASILEIGCGWGGFAEEASKQNARITGLTISPAQHQYATARLGDKADIRLQDYRSIREKFDSIVSIEMFEAVGENYWPVYFKTVADNLKSGGKAVIQTIMMRDEDFADYRQRSDFIRHYVFPGGMLPSPQRFREEAARAGLKCRELVAFGHDYADTLREWLKRFEARREEIVAMGYSESFIRNWRFYLALCAATFAVGRTNVMQMELEHA